MIRPVKFSLYNLGTQFFGWRIEPEFLVLSRLRPVRLALDIGGNWGQSVFALKYTAKPDRIVTFEPNQDLARRLSVKFRADPTIGVENVALGDVSGSFDLHVPRYRNFVYDGLASIDRDQAATWLNPERMANFDPAKHHLDRQTVPVVRLDSLELSPDVVKMDVQGAELDVVRGGIETFRKCRPATIVETPGRELTELFASFGMSPYIYSDGHLVPDPSNSRTNTIFLTPEHVGRVQ